jgi:hypothetical protein
LHAFGSNGSIKEVLLLSDLWLLSEAQMRRIEPYFHCRTAFRGSMTGAS